MSSMDRLLFIGIGGTGGSIGVHLEDNLRRRLCGPTGQLLRDVLGDELAPFQLPDFVRSVYIDLDGEVVDDLSRSQLTRNTNAIAASRRVLRNLMPPPTSYPEIADRLRAGATAAVAGWLPPSDSEPDVSPLSTGAGQFPTVGRAALYEMLRCKGAKATLVGPLREAIGELDASDRQLRMLKEDAGFSSQRCNVYIAFSLAGGTGCGLFLDVLHLVEDCFAVGTRLQPVIHPLVALPSSFEESKGGGLEGQLNAATGIIDLARFIDSQNTGQISSIVVPDGRANSIELSTRGTALARTAYVFSRPATHSPDDHVRVMANFAAAQVAPTSDEQVRADLNHNQVGVNRSTQRSEIARHGVGRHPFTTAYSAALSVPAAELSTALGELVIHDAVRDAHANSRNETLRVSDEDVLDAIEASCGVLDARNQNRPAGVQSLDGVTGAAGIRAALNNRRRRAQEAVAEYEGYINRAMREIVSFNWRRALTVAGDRGADPFQLARVVGAALGADRTFKDRLEEVGELTNKGSSKGSARPPGIPQLGRPGRSRFLKSNSSTVNKYIDELNGWQNARVDAAWRAAWLVEENAVVAIYEDMRETVELLAAVLRTRASQGRSDADRSFSRVFERRQGVINFIPQVSSTSALRNFRDDALDRIYGGRSLRNSPGIAVTLMHRIGFWEEVIRTAATNERRSVLDGALQATAGVTSHVASVLGRSDGDQQALLPPLSDMLQLAADGLGPEGSPLNNQITGVVANVMATAADVELEASQIVISYPTSGIRDGQAVEVYLRRMLENSAPASASLTIQRSDGTDLVVTAMRTEVALLDVPEAVRCVRVWDAALNRPSTDGLLPWRQRTGWNRQSYLVSEEDEVTILFALLNALWSGLAVPRADEPTARGGLLVDLHPPSYHDLELRELLVGINMTLELNPLVQHGLSSWTGLISAFEHFVVNASEAQLASLGQWMSHIPSGTLFGETEQSGYPLHAYCEFHAKMNSDLLQIDSMLRSTSLSSGELARVLSARRLLSTSWPDALRRGFPGNTRFRNHVELHDRDCGHGHGDR